MDGVASRHLGEGRGGTMQRSLLRSPAQARRLLLIAGAVVVLSACNPLTVRLNDPSGPPLVTYYGPDGGWLELSFSGLGGVEVEYSIQAINFSPEPRSCRDAVTGQ